MQLISEVYDILKNVGKLNNKELHEVFARWNNTELQSFLVDITADIFLKQDAETGKDLVDVILDKARQKGTGMWTSQSAMELNVPTPVIDAAVSMRYLSSMKEERLAAAEKLKITFKKNTAVEKAPLIELCKGALYFGQALSYGQGLHLLAVASTTYDYKINIAEVVRIWKGGCIIRSAMLNDLREVYLQDATLLNIVQSSFQQKLLQHRQAIATLVQLAADHHIPVACLSAALNYFDAYCSKLLPANLIQAQRDYFGAHTYERIDKTGRFHTEWN
jgi:6-phosphogluconate dehydrogenase